MSAAYIGPRPACQDLKSLADDVGNPLVELIEGLPLNSAQKAQAIEQVESILTTVFMGTKVHALEEYIYQLDEEVKYFKSSDIA